MKFVVYRDKLVWNSTLNAWVAVSELAKGKKKSSKTLLKAGVLVGSMVFAVNAQAAPGEGTYSIKEGPGSASAGESAVAVMYQMRLVMRQLLLAIIQLQKNSIQLL